MATFFPVANITNNEQLWNQLTSSCINIVPQLSAYYSGILYVPPIITHCSPHSIEADLHPASSLYWSINQAKSSISTTLGSCGEKEENIVSHFTWQIISIAYS